MTISSETMQFLAARSRWMNFWLCRKYMPSAISAAICISCISVGGGRPVLFYNTNTDTAYGPVYGPGYGPWF